jgi:hypothetical protein
LKKVKYSLLGGYCLVLSVAIQGAAPRARVQNETRYFHYVRRYYQAAPRACVQNETGSESIDLQRSVAALRTRVQNETDNPVFGTL